MGPDRSLPASLEFESSEAYVDSLLGFVDSSDLLKTLCGGVHILDFFTKAPYLYSVIFPQDWRSFFAQHDIMHILDLFMREDLESFVSSSSETWRDGPLPPSSLISYLKDVRRHCLHREFEPIRHSLQQEKLARNISLGMKVKKIHEVDHFSRYVEKLTAEIADSRKQPITHLVDLGSGQGYLPRCLASPPYNRHTVAIESKQHNIEGAKSWDVKAKLAPKPMTIVDKKTWRAERSSAKADGTLEKRDLTGKTYAKGERRGLFVHPGKPGEEKNITRANLEVSSLGAGSVQYVEHWIDDGDLSRVIAQIADPSVVHEETNQDQSSDEDQKKIFVEESLPPERQKRAQDPSLMVISLHSCGNLVHHGIRSLLLNPAVSAVALVGCCYNLVTERLGPPTYKLPSLRLANARLEETSNSHDPHGFPMSERLCNFETPTGKGLRLNITARMMAVQAPQNWGEKDSEAFFTRHFYRALLQRVLLDLGIVEPPKDDDDNVGQSSPLGWSGNTQPIILGSLRKACYADFVNYVRGAAEKLVQEPERGAIFREKFSKLTDEDIRRYEERYAEGKKELSVVWSLMAFSAGVIEATMVTDRWLFLKEQQEVEEAWVEPVFDYRQSPRNLVVVGIKR